MTQGACFSSALRKRYDAYVSGRSLEADPMCASVPEIFSSVGFDRIIKKDRQRSDALRLIKVSQNSESNGVETRPQRRL